MSEEPTWKMENEESYPKLAEDTEADIVIIGGGITGIFSAYLLSELGYKIVLLEKKKALLEDTTLYTTAFITKVIDTSFSELISIFGQQKAEAIWQSGQLAVFLIADIVKREKIDCEFEFSPLYIYAQTENDFDHLIHEHTLIKKAGFESELREVEDSPLGFKNSGFLKIHSQAKFHPIKFGRALAKKAAENGVRIFTDTEAVDIKDGGVITTKDHSIKTKHTIISTYAPLTNHDTHFKKAMYQTYVYELEIPKDEIMEGLYQDIHNPYHYFRIDKGERSDRMIIGGEDHREDIKADPEISFDALLKYTAKIVGKKNYKIKRKWTGPILEPVDGLPFIGEIYPNIFVATAFSGNGMTYAAISAEIFRDLITGKENPYAEIYSPKRHMTVKQLGQKAIDYTEELFGGIIKNLLNP